MNCLLALLLYCLLVCSIAYLRHRPHTHVGLFFVHPRNKQAAKHQPRVNQKKIRITDGPCRSPPLPFFFLFFLGTSKAEVVSDQIKCKLRNYLQ